MELKALGWVFVALLTTEAVWSVFRHPCAYSKLTARDRREIDEVCRQIFVKHTNRNTTYVVISDAFKLSIAVVVGFVLLLP